MLQWVTWCHQCAEKDLTIYLSPQRALLWGSSCVKAFLWLHLVSSLILWRSQFHLSSLRGRGGGGGTQVFSHQKFLRTLWFFCCICGNSFGQFRKWQELHLMGERSNTCIHKENQSRSVCVWGGLVVSTFKIQWLFADTASQQSAAGTDIGKPAVCTTEPSTDQQIRPQVPAPQCCPGIPSLHPALEKFPHAFLHVQLCHRDAAEAPTYLFSSMGQPGQCNAAPAAKPVVCTSVEQLKDWVLYGKWSSVFLLWTVTQCDLTVQQRLKEID